MREWSTSTAATGTLEIVCLVIYEAGQEGLLIHGRTEACGLAFFLC